MQPAHKFCPKCNQPAVLSMPQCRRCGYIYPRVMNWTRLLPLTAAIVLIVMFLMSFKLARTAFGPDSITVNELDKNNLLYDGHVVKVRGYVIRTGNYFGMPDAVQLVDRPDRRVPSPFTFPPTTVDPKPILLYPPPGNVQSGDYAEAIGLFMAEANGIRCQQAEKIDTPR